MLRIVVDIALADALRPPSQIVLILHRVRYRVRPSPEPSFEPTLTHRGVLGLPLTCSDILAMLRRVRPALRLKSVPPSLTSWKEFSMIGTTCWRLVELSLSSRHSLFGAVGASPAQVLLHCPNLHTFGLSGCQLSCSDGTEIARTLASNTLLERLDLSRAKFRKYKGSPDRRDPEDAAQEAELGAALRAALEVNSTLRFLDLSGTINGRRVDRMYGADNGVAFDVPMAAEVLRGACANKGLVELRLDGNLVSISDVCGLLHANKTLTRLNVQGVRCSTICA